MRNAIRTKVRLAVASVAILAGQPLLAQHELAKQKAAPTQVSVDDIGEGVILVGRLKKPLGTMMTVRGKWSFPREEVKDYSLRFTISHVDGQKLKKPVELHVAQVNVVTKSGKDAIPPHDEHKQLDGMQWTIRAYETGKINHIPEDYWKELGEFLPQMPYWYREFTSELNGVLISAEKLR